MQKTESSNQLVHGIFQAPVDMIEMNKIRLSNRSKFILLPSSHLLPLLTVILIGTNAAIPASIFVGW